MLLREVIIINIVSVVSFSSSSSIINSISIRRHPGINPIPPTVKD